MGGTVAAPARRVSTDRAALSTEEYNALRESLGAVEDRPGSTVELGAFLGRFPPHLRPLVQPLFFRLAGGRQPAAPAGRFQEPRAAGGSAPSTTPRAGAPASPAAAGRAGAVVPSLKEDEDGPCATWPSVVEGMSLLMRSGATWPMLFEAWLGHDAVADPRAEAARAEAAAELAAALCFWCAHPSLAPCPGPPNGIPPSAATAAVLAGWRPEDLEDPFESARVALRWPQATGPPADADSVRRRIEQCAPCLPRGVVPRTAQAVLGASPAPDFPRLRSRVLDRGLAFLLRGMSEPLWAAGATWALLYADWQDGLSFGAFLRGVLHYQGLAALVVRGLEGGEIFGAVSDCWEEGGSEFGGGPDCLLFALRPTLHVFRTTGRAKNRAYLNSRSKSMPRGVGFGGQNGCCRLWIGADFDSCQVLQSDATYAAGPLLPESASGGGTACQISHIEVWGISGCRRRPRPSDAADSAGGASSGGDQQQV